MTQSSPESGIRSAALRRTNDSSSAIKSRIAIGSRTSFSSQLGATNREGARRSSGLGLGILHFALYVYTVKAVIPRGHWQRNSGLELFFQFVELISKG